MVEYGASPAVGIERLRADLTNPMTPHLINAVAAATGDSGILPNPRARAVTADVNVTALASPDAGVTAPSVIFALERLGADGIWYPLWTSPSIAVAGKTSVSVGDGLEVNKLPAGDLRLRWTVVGTVDFTASIVGR